MDEQENPGPTSALPEHAWLKNLVGEWTTETDFGGGEEAPRGKGREVIEMLGDLWAVGEGEIEFPDGGQMITRLGLGFDVSSKQYRAFWVASVSSHLWQYTCTLSEDGRTLTMDCEGPDMVGDKESVHYQDIIELIDADHRTHTSTGPDKDGNMVTYMKNYYTRVK